MAEINLIAMRNCGPSIPADISVWLLDKPYPGGGTFPVLMLGIGSDSVSIWPAEPEVMRCLAERLKAVAEEIDQRRQSCK